MKYEIDASFVDSNYKLAKFTNIGLPKIIIILPKFQVGLMPVLHLAISVTLPSPKAQLEHRVCVLMK
jgi:hypothetical protein